MSPAVEDDFATARELKRQNEGAAFPEDLEWSYYSELYDVIDPENAPTAGPAAALRFNIYRSGTNSSRPMRKARTSSRPTSSPAAC